MKKIISIVLLAICASSGILGAPCLTDEFEARQTRRSSRIRSVLNETGLPSLVEVPLTTMEEPATTPEEARTTTEEHPTTTEEHPTTTEEPPTTTEEAGTITEEAGTITEEAGTITEEAGTITEEAGTIAEEAGTIAEEAGTTTTEEPILETTKTEQITTTESVIKKAAKNLAESFHKLSNRWNKTMMASSQRSGRSGLLRLPGESDEGNELTDFLGFRLPPPLTMDGIRNSFKNIPTLPPLFKPTPPMHSIGISGLLSDGNLHNLARG